MLLANKMSKNECFLADDGGSCEKTVKIKFPVSRKIRHHIRPQAFPDPVGDSKTPPFVCPLCNLQFKTMAR
jgi:hypothetical protein